MPYVNLNGQLIEVTQEQYDIYTIGQNQGQIATPQTPAQAASAVAAGGTVTETNTVTSTILTPNTTNTSPGQTLIATGTPAVTPASTTTSIEAQSTNNVAVSGITNNSATAIDPASTLSPGETIVSANSVNTSAKAVSPTASTSIAYDDDGNLLPGFQLDENNNPVFTSDTTTTFNPDGSVIQGKIKNAQQQQTLADQRKQINNGDWRVRLRLAPQSNYLYNADNPGILQPLKVTDGVVFPYTPTISTSYRATYSPYDVTHSNYRGYYYQNSYVDAINLTATFTAQDTNDANYLLAVIQFFRSATKMFYGQDAERGSPPPLVYLSGFGDYQFREHACVISQFQYNLPADVDYIRAGSPNNAGLNFNNIRERQSVATNSIFGSINRLAAAFLPKGALSSPPAPPTLGLNRPTYVPTKMEIQLSLLPMQSRNQVSTQFSLKNFASGDLLKGGFW